MEAERFPVSVRLIGVMHKEKSKMYMTSVLWSDQNDIIVYRRFKDFKKMHKQMKKAFPTTGKLNKSDRVIPKFRDKQMKQRGQRKGPTKSLLCLKLLQKYCDELLGCDPRVCQSAVLIQFFHPSDQDLQPEFAKNGILIMPTDDEIKTSPGHSNSGNVTQPFVTETYRCVAPYETKDTKNKPFKVAVNEKVDVLIKDKGGWWLVEREDKRMAWFPAPYLEKLDEDEDDDGDDVNETFDRGMKYTVIKTYKASKDDELTVNIGSVVEVLQTSDNGWWLVSHGGKAGYVPAMYLQLYNYPHVRMTAQLQERRASAQLQLQLPSPGLQQSQQLSRSQGNLLQLPSARAPSPSLHQADKKQRSHSLTTLSEQPPAQPAARTSASNAVTTPTSAKHVPLPAIKVEMDGQEGHGRILSAGSERSLGSYSSDSSDRSDLSFGDDLSLNLSHSANDERLRFSRTPPPMVSNHLSPTSCPKKITPSVSDPSLFKGPTAPKVPPRPRAQEILTRCSTVTRKNASRGNLSPTHTEILSR